MSGTAIASALGRLHSACVSIGARGVHWDECTAEAEPLRIRGIEAKRRAIAAIGRLRAEARSRRCGRMLAMYDALRDIEGAWNDVVSVYQEWAIGYEPDDPVGSVLSEGGSALSDIRRAMDAEGGS